VIETPIESSVWSNQLFAEAYRQLVPMDRFARPGEIASLAAFLMSDGAAFITGETIVIDGGQLACQDNDRFESILDRNSHDGG
jgi:NAD(P)-dependent dehydrogenase (short-subunit alcohol dehydrogenase family)